MYSYIVIVDVTLKLHSDKRPNYFGSFERMTSGVNKRRNDRCRSCRPMSPMSNKYKSKTGVLTQGLLKSTLVFKCCHHLKNMYIQYRLFDHSQF